jgi:hypothetical protein
VWRTTNQGFIIDKDCKSIASLVCTISRRRGEGRQRSKQNKQNPQEHSEGFLSNCWQPPQKITAVNFGILISKQKQSWIPQQQIGGVLLWLPISSRIRRPTTETTETERGSETMTAPAISLLVNARKRPN